MRFVRETRDKFSGGSPHAGAVMEWQGRPPRIVTASVPAALNGLGFGLAIGLASSSGQTGFNNLDHALAALSDSGASTTMHGVTTYDVDRGELDKSNDEEYNEGDRAGVVTNGIVSMQCDEKINPTSAIHIRIKADGDKIVGMLTNTEVKDETGSVGTGIKVVHVYDTITIGSKSFNIANVLLDSEFGITITKKT